MPPKTPTQLEDWVRRWAEAGPALEAVRRQELRDFRYEDHAAAIDALLEISARYGTPRMSSGLVEQQRLFAKLRT
jgi:hypothetical protein